MPHCPIGDVVSGFRESIARHCHSNKRGFGSAGGTERILSLMQDRSRRIGANIVMRIAFDLDGTLIPGPGSPMRIERLGWLARLISREQIREGAPGLLRALRRQGHEVWIYTASLRSPARLRLWFASFGVLLDGVINQTVHNTAMAGTSNVCSKYPPAFGIELLIDDATGLLLEGERLGFPVVRILEDDSSWCSRITGHLGVSESPARNAAPISGCD
jgi:hypothetical protein